MPLRNARTVTFRPVGLSDTLDGSNQFAGAMAQLANLVPDPSTMDAWVCRPAAVALSTFSGFMAPGFVSAALVVGNMVYGMLATGRNAGHDEPFALNLLTGVFLTIGNVTAANTPASPPSTGDWTPPTLDLVGTRVIVTHPGFPGGATKFGWFDVSNYSTTQSCTTTNGSNTVTSAVNLLQAGVQPGDSATGPGVPANTYVVSVALNGLSVVLSNACTAGATVNLTFAGGTSGAPLWGAGDTNINALPSVPVAVKQFNGRAWFACGAAVVGSDSGFACQVTNASQAVTFLNGLPVTALGTYGLLSQTQGGVIQSLFCFQGVSLIQQITGDFATSNLSRNALNVATGTLAPLSVCPTNQGLLFVAPDGLRLIDTAANISDPIGASGEGITVPFINAAHPSRICAAANSGVVRVSVLNGKVGGTPSQDYWLDLTRKKWSGPHTFPSSLVQPWGQTFVMAPVGVAGALFQSDVTPTAVSTFTENGTALQWIYQTSELPDDGAGAMLNICYATLTAAMPAASSFSVSVQDDTGVNLALATIDAGGSSSLWGGFNWGTGTWGSPVSKPYQRPIDFSEPVEAKQMSIQVTGFSAYGLSIGNLYVTAQELGYNLERLS